MKQQTIEFIARHRANMLKLKIIEYLPVDKQGKQMEQDISYISKLCNCQLMEAEKYINIYCKTLNQAVD